VDLLVGFHGLVVPNGMNYILLCCIMSYYVMLYVVVCTKYHLTLFFWTGFVSLTTKQKKKSAVDYIKPDAPPYEVPAFVLLFPLVFRIFFFFLSSRNLLCLQAFSHSHTHSHDCTELRVTCTPTWSGFASPTSQERTT
jgi:hypothetical protein